MPWCTFQIPVTATSTSLYLVKLPNIHQVQLHILLYNFTNNEKFVKQRTELGESVSGKSYQPLLEERELLTLMFGADYHVLVPLIRPEAAAAVAGAVLAVSSKICLLRVGE